ncbi:MAG TPA: septal ring lytic transglycosylase RlpA family protein [Microvirga sp.]|jgi:rare lipoprotein A|nr:septal ring lytic transglycosylase RlpA family protein [Microvirga sp.]
MNTFSTLKIAALCLGVVAAAGTAEAKSLRKADGAAPKSARSGQVGQASWYGPGFHGRRTANGETFNAGAYTAAHRYLPFGTRLKVVNKNNGRSVVVRINDRGPFHGGRIIDLSRASAQAIGLSGVGAVALSQI